MTSLFESSTNKQIWNFSPQSIPGCTLWLDGADASTIFSDKAGTTLSGIGDSVAVWKDKSLSAGIVFNTITVPTGGFTASGGAVTLTLSSTTNIFAGTTVTIANVVSTGSLTSLNGNYTVTRVSGNAITFANSTPQNSVTTSGTVTIDSNDAIGPAKSATSSVASGATPAATTISYSTTLTGNTIALGMLIGNLVTTTGITPSTFNVTNAVISSITLSGSTYTIVVNSTSAAGESSPATTGGLMTFTNAKFPTRRATSLSFSGSQYLALANPSLLPTGASNTTRFIVSKTNDTTTRQNIFSHGANAGGGGHNVQYNVNGANSSSTYFITNAFPLPNSDIQSIDNLHMITGQFNYPFQSGWHNGSSYPNYNNGDVVTILSPTAVNVGTVFGLIGNSISVAVSPYTRNSQGLDGNISEIIVYNNALSTTQRQQIEGYLAWKWGLQAQLPAGHPYLPTASIRAGPYLKAFKPLDISNCCMWYDGADKSSMTINESNQLTQWRDKSGNGYNLTPFSAGPTITSSSSNAVGYDIVFNGSNVLSNGLINTSMSPGISTTQFTYFMVFVNNDTNYGRYFSGSDQDADNSDLHGVLSTGYDSNHPNLVFFIIDNKGPTPTVVAANYHIASCVWSTSSTGIVYIDGATTPGSNITGATNTLTFSKFGIGITPSNSGNRLGGNSVVNEFVAFTSALTDSQRQQMEGYLAWKWGLQRATYKIPTTHPFYNFPSATVTP